MVIKKNYVEKNSYYDSVFLMKLSRNISELGGVQKISVGMGTPLNKDTLKDLELLISEGEDASPNDLIIALSADSEEDAEKARVEFMRLLLDSSSNGKKSYRSIEKLCSEKKDVNLAVISVAGEFAADEAMTAVENGLNVFMFSDNVPIEREVELKQLADKKGLLVMGPSCGLSYINNTALGLCSKARPGDIGIVGASGSGIQEVMAIVHRIGSGISHAIGTGGRDLSKDVGGITMLKGISLLEEDSDTSVIVLISKPPAAETTRKILDAVSSCKKPVVIQFINSKNDGEDAEGVFFSDSFEETAKRAVALSEGKSYEAGDEIAIEQGLIETASKEIPQFSPEQKYLRGIFCGGALSEEALTFMNKNLGDIYSNVSFDKDFMLDDPFKSFKDSIIDIGEEDFTRGKPHVAIDPSVRIDRFNAESEDPETAVILLDFLLGFGCHEDPTGMMIPHIREQRLKAESAGRNLCIVASVCGTDIDPQDYSEQVKKLEDAGVLVAENNGRAAQLAAILIKQLRERG